MTVFVRVRLENGSEASVSAAFAKSHDLKPLSKPSSQGRRALPAKHDPLKKPRVKPADETSEQKEN